MTTVEYRELLLEDADALGAILGVTWHADEAGEGDGNGSSEAMLAGDAAGESGEGGDSADASAAAQALYGLVDFAQYAQRHTFAQVAVMGSKPVGVVMARAGKADAATQAQWRAVADDARRQLVARGESLAEFDAFFRAMDGVDVQLLAESGCDDRFELVLFAVGPETRGHGVGTKLLTAAQDYLREQGAKQAFLFTDTDCTWEYYERRGMRRAAERAFAPGELLPAGMFVYEMPL